MQPLKVYAIAYAEIARYMPQREFGKLLLLLGGLFAAADVLFNTVHHVAKGFHYRAKDRGRSAITIVR